MSQRKHTLYFLSEEEFYINDEIRKEFEDNDETYEYYRQIIPISEGIPLFHLTKTLVEEHDTIYLPLASQERSHMFIAHCYYYLLSNRNVHLTENTVAAHSQALELATQDLKTLLADYCSYAH